MLHESGAFAGKGRGEVEKERGRGGEQGERESDNTESFFWILKERMTSQKKDSGTAMPSRRLCYILSFL